MWKVFEVFLVGFDIKFNFKFICCFFYGFGYFKLLFFVEYYGFILVDDLNVGCVFVEVVVVEGFGLFLVNGFLLLFGCFFVGFDDDFEG